MNTLQVPYNGTCHVFTLAVQHQNIAAKDLACSVWKSLPLGFLIPSSSSCHQWSMKLLFSLFLSLFSSLFFPSSLLVITGPSPCAVGCVWREVLTRVWCPRKSQCFVSEAFYSPRGLQKVSFAYGSEDERALADTCAGQHLHWDFVLIIQKQQNQLIHGKQTITRSMCYWGVQITQGYVGS